LAQKKFFQEQVSDTASQYKLNTSKFFDGGLGKTDPSKALGDTF